MILKTLKRPLTLLLALALFFVWFHEKELYAMPVIQRTVLPNGLVILHAEDHSLPFVTMRLLVAAGSRRDPSGQEGLASLTADSLLFGTSGHSADAINQEIDFMGASLGASSGRDYSTVSLRTLSKDLDSAAGIFMEVLTSPTFPDEEIKREVEKTLAAIRVEEDQPGSVAEKAFRKALFGTSPYGHPVIGTKESLPGITREAILRFYRTYYHPNNYILVVVGDISPEKLKSQVISRFEKMEAAQLPVETLKSVFAEGPETIKINRELTQANIIIGSAGISRENPDFYAVSLMNYILGGGGFASRLLEEIRNRRGLAYSVDSFFDAGKYPGSFQIVLQTKNASAAEAISLALQQIELIQKEPVSDRELEGAKKYLTGSFPLRLDTQSKLSDFLLQVEYYGLGLDYPEKYPSLIKSVTKDDVLRVAKKYLHPKSSIQVVVADLKETKLGSTLQPGSLTK
jgi:zinc protease